MLDSVTFVYFKGKKKVETVFLFRLNMVKRLLHPHKVILLLKLDLDGFSNSF